MGKHIPGRPNVVVSNVPGAGGNVLANNLYTLVPKDGTYMGITFPSVIIDPLLSENHRGYDPTKFNYIGNANAEVLVCLLRRDVGVKSLEDFLRADLVIGAVLVTGAKAPKLVTREMVSKMQPGSVIVDIAIDQGGSLETSKPTTHANPTYVDEGVVHYCVTNMPGAVGRTSTYALCNVTFPYLKRIVSEGLPAACQRDSGLAAAVNLLDGRITNQAVAETFGLPLSSLF